MANVYISSVQWAYRGKRGHGSAEVPVSPPSPPSQLAPGDQFQPPWVTPTTTNTQGKPIIFAFWSITGGIGDPIATTNNPPGFVKVGNSDIVAKAWYIEQGTGPNGGGTYIIVDAFDAASGMFVDNDFVKVKDANNTENTALSASTNLTGYLSTKSLEYVDAQTPINNVPFDKWAVVMGTEPVTDKEITAKAGTNAIAFAIYMKQSNTLVVPNFNETLWNGILFGVMNDAPGLTWHGPVGPWDPFGFQLVVGMALAETAKLINNELKADVLKLAAKQILTATKAINENLLSAAKGK